MGDSYKVVLESIKKWIRKRYYDIQVVEDKNLLYFDIGIGEKFVVITLPVDSDFSIKNLAGFMSVEVFLEIIRRFIEIKPPNGHRVRFVIFKDYKKDYSVLFEHLTLLGKDRVLLLIDVTDLGLGNEKIVINGLSDKIIPIIHKALMKSGLNFGMINVRDLTFQNETTGLEIIKFCSFPNLYKTKMPKDVYDIKRRDFGVALMFLVLNAVLST